MSLQIRVCAGAIVVRDERLLLVRLCKPGAPDWWMPPGGGLEPGEGILQGAEREAWEETGLCVAAERIVYITETLDAQYHHVRFWVLCDCSDDCEPHLANTVEEERPFMRAVRFYSRDETRELMLFPEVFRDQFWEDHVAGFPVLRHVPLVAEIS